MLTPDELWSDHNAMLPRWYNLPIDTAAYAYQTSFEYNGLAGVLDRVNNYVDRNIRSPQELVDDSQLYQAFIFKYATEAYRRKKYHPVNGTRIWAYGEVTPGIRFNFLDYYRVPKMGYYYLKSAQQRFAVSLAYEQALESQVSGTSLKIPVWAVNDYPRPVSVNLHCEIRDSGGGQVWTKDSSAAVGPDASGQIDAVDWVTPSKPGVYVLSAQVSEKTGPILASTSAFIKVTPALFSRAHNVLVIGDRKFAYPVAQMLRAMGLSVTEMYEQNFPAFAQLGSSAAIRQKYDLVWLTAADSIWKLLGDNEAEALRDAIHEGVGFIHTGGSGSFHGGFGRAAGLDFTALADVLPVTLKSRNDVIFDQIEGPEANIAQRFSPIKTIGAGHQADAVWSDFGLARFGVPGFNNVEAKPDGDVRLTISGRPLLVTGHFGRGRTAVFTGFTPAYSPRTATWDPTVEFPYLVDQEFSSRPVTKSYFSVFMRMVAAALGETPAADYDALLAARDKPLFQTLKELPPADVEFIGATKPVVTGREATFSVTLSGRRGYARLVRLGDHWDVGAERAPYLALYGDNYFDIPAGGHKTVEIKLFLPEGHPGEVSGSLEMFGTNAPLKSMPVRFSN